VLLACSLSLTPPVGKVFSPRSTIQGRSKRTNLRSLPPIASRDEPAAYDISWGYQNGEEQGGDEWRRRRGLNKMSSRLNVEAFCSCPKIYGQRAGDRKRTSICKLFLGGPFSPGSEIHGLSSSGTSHLDALINYVIKPCRRVGDGA